MKTKYLSVMLVTGAMALGATPAIAESSDTAELNFYCQVVDGVPTTLAQPTGSDAKMPIFHWKEEALRGHTRNTPQQLCDITTAKLEDYSDQGYDLSKISFVGTNQLDLPAICASAGNGDCSKVLLTLPPDQNNQPDIVAKNIVDSIIDKDLQQFKQEQYNDRGLQSTRYDVDFWSLFGLKFLGK